MFDSADDLETVDLKRFFPAEAHGDIILTSRSRQAKLLGESLEVECLPLHDATELLAVGSGRKTDEGSFSLPA